MEVKFINSENDKSKYISSDKKAYYHVTLLSNLMKGYDKYSGRYSKSNIEQSRYPYYFFLLPKDQLAIGLEKARGLLAKNGKENDKPIIIKTYIQEAEVRPNTVTGTGLGLYIDRNWIKLDGILSFIDGQIIQESLEDQIALSYKLNFEDEINYEQCIPRSISLLPIARGCQARCSFCFSKSSISLEQLTGKAFEHRYAAVLESAKKSGAERAVITGGGEPGLLKLENLCQLVRTARNYFNKVVLISNGYFLQSEAQAKIQALYDAGLTVLSISRHHYDDSINNNIMKLSVNVSDIARCVSEMNDAPNLILRWICVLQKGGIATRNDIKKYIEWAHSLGVDQVCFKELYVSSSSESFYYNHESNVWSKRNQIPLSLVVDYCTNESMQLVGSLPWGSPIYRWENKNKSLDISAYTEPSVYWELTNGICRSWNLMADGDCYASLERKDSKVDPVP